MLFQVNAEQAAELLAIALMVEDFDSLETATTVSG
jgi:hypothetical protein